MRCMVVSTPCIDHIWAGGDCRAERIPRISSVVSDCEVIESHWHFIKHVTVQMDRTIAMRRVQCTFAAPIGYDLFTFLHDGIGLSRWGIRFSSPENSAHTEHRAETLDMPVCVRNKKKKKTERKRASIVSYARVCAFLLLSEVRCRIAMVCAWLSVSFSGSLFSIFLWLFFGTIRAQTYTSYYAFVKAMSRRRKKKQRSFIISQKKPNVDSVTIVCMRPFCILYISLQLFVSRELLFTLRCCCPCRLCCCAVHSSPIAVRFNSTYATVRCEGEWMATTSTMQRWCRQRRRQR